MNSRPTSAVLRSSSSIGRATLLTAWLLATAPGAKAQTGDLIRFQGGEELRGRVSAQRLDGLVVSIRSGRATTFPWSEVASVEYDGPPTFDEAVRFDSAGMTDEALRRYGELVADKGLRGPLRQESLVRLARLERRSARWDRALQHYQDLADGFPQGRYLLEAAEGIVECDLHLADPAAAGRALDRIEAALGRDARFASVANLLRAEIGEAQGRLDEARGRYEQAENDERLETAGRETATLGLGRCLQAQGRLAEAESRYRDLVRRGSSSHVLAGAWNGLGDLALSAGRKARDPGRIEQALFAYMRGVVLYTPDEGEPGAESRRATEGAAQCYESLAQLASDPGQRKLDRRRAGDLRARLTAP